MEPGNLAYYKCSGCDLIFKDASGLTETSLSAVTIPKSDHTLTPVDKVEANCYNDGKEAHYKCDVCKKLFKSITGSEEITDESTLTIGKYAHKLTHFEKVDSTCEKEGNNEYWTCSLCKKKFKDDKGENVASDDEIKIAPKGHIWGEWEIVEEATAAKAGLKKRICERDASHVDTETIPKLSLAEIGDTYTFDGIIYEITSVTEGAREVKVNGVEDKNIEELKIPAKVTIDGKEYGVLLWRSKEM